jgi:hypothetical protein
MAADTPGSARQVGYCSTCQFVDTPTSECRIAAPVIDQRLTGGNINNVGIWPVVSLKSGWCGDYAPATSQRPVSK